MSTTPRPRGDHPEDRDHQYDAERHLPSHHNPLPALSEASPSGAHRYDPAPEDFAAVAESPEFAELRRKFRGFAFPMTLAFLVWYFAYVLLSTYAEDFMATRLGGSAITIGLLLGVLQFVTTFLLTWLYIRHANKNLDPIATRLKAQLEGPR
ncbi:hypothetical protein GCM10027418_25180 [Mariniluteicoccus endophyticus]